MSENEELKFDGAKEETSPGSGVEPEKVLETIQAQSEQQPKFLTADEFKVEMEKFSAQIEEKVSRKAQGLVDKSNNRLNQKVQEVVNLVENATGAQLTAAQRKAIKYEMAMESLSEPEAKTEVAQPAPRQQLDPVSIKAQGILESFGLAGFDKNSPNAVKINRNTTDPKEFLASVREYCVAESTRLEASKSQDRPNPESLLPIGGEGKAGDLKGEFDKKLKNIPRGEAGLMQRQMLISEYRKKGLTGI